MDQTGAGRQSSLAREGALTRPTSRGLIPKSPSTPEFATREQSLRASQGIAGNFLPQLLRDNQEQLRRERAAQKAGSRCEYYP